MTDLMSESEFTIMSVSTYSYSCESIRASFEQSDYDTISNSRVCFFILNF
jgi:hypothetical protein